MARIYRAMVGLEGPMHPPLDIAVTTTPRPAAFGFYEEGDGVLSLYLAPLRAERVLEPLLGCLGHATPVYLGDAPAPRGARPLPSGGWVGTTDHLDRLEAPAELLFVERPRIEAIEALPGSLLAHPEKALPDSLKARAALILTVHDHAIVLSRDKSVLAACLAPLLEGLANAELPPLTELLEPMADSAWREVHVDSRQRYRLMHLDLRDADRLVEEDTWVAPGEGGQWRASWSW